MQNAGENLNDEHKTIFVDENGNVVRSFKRSVSLSIGTVVGFGDGQRLRVISSIYNGSDHRFTATVEEVNHDDSDRLVTESTARRIAREEAERAVSELIEQMQLGR